ncbi:Hypothetical predicted protein [Lecanosticta acicola]|uniref:Uncharacterized protein n=1 Tax=Lecanosticta acicola TaxID=111012 RepID=A0AAI8YYZ4_9PEZI|nr:Hypothetical predicted protein [Lecanosticta acicola]
MWEKRREAEDEMSNLEVFGGTDEEEMRLEDFIALGGKPVSRGHLSFQDADLRILQDGAFGGNLIAKTARSQRKKRTGTRGRNGERVRRTTSDLDVEVNVMQYYSKSALIIMLQACFERFGTD